MHYKLIIHSLSYAYHLKYRNYYTNACHWPQHKLLRIAEMFVAENIFNN